MRVEIKCKLEKAEAPLVYHRKILSCFKSCLENYNREIKEYFYNSSSPKDITFACYFPFEKIENGKLKLKRTEFSIFLSVNSVVDAIHYYNSLIGAKKKKKKFKMEENNSFMIANIINIKEKEIKNNVSYFRIMSPIIIREKREGQSDWYHLLDEKGIAVLKKNLQYVLKDRFSKEAIEKLEIIPIDLKKNVSKFYDIHMSGTRGVFGIKGDKELLNYFYKSGIGSRKSSGFGMLELIS